MCGCAGSQERVPTDATVLYVFQDRGILHALLGACCLCVVHIFARVTLLVMALFLILLFYIPAVSEEVQRPYDAFFYGGVVLSKLWQVPKLVIGSMNKETGRPLIFTCDFMVDF